MYDFTKLQISYNGISSNNVHYKDYQALTSKRDSCIEMTIYGSEGGSFGVISSIVFTENHNDTGVLDLQIC